MFQVDSSEKAGWSWGHDGVGYFVPVTDLNSTLRRAVTLARAAGLESATELEDRAFAAYTTSSEWLGEVGEAIRQFRVRERDKVPPEVSRLLDLCLTEVGKVWPRYRPSRIGAMMDRMGRLWKK